MKKTYPVAKISRTSLDTTPRYLYAVENQLER